MKTIVLVGCGKEKLNHRAKAKDLYTGDLFRKARAYAEQLGDEWGILSAKHFLLMPDQMVDSYDLCLNDLDRDHMSQWIVNTNWQLRSRWPGRKFVCLAGELYGRAFQKPVKLEAEFPMAGMSIGRRLQYLNSALKKDSYQRAISS